MASYVMSVSRGKKHKNRDGSPDRDTSSHEPSSPRSRLLTGDHGKTKKRKVTDLSCSSTEEQYNRSLEIQSVSPIPKKKKKGDNVIEDQTVQQPETSTKKKKRREDSHQEADDFAADDTFSSIDSYQVQKEKSRQSYKAKDSKRLHRDKDFSEGAPYTEFSHLEGRVKKKKDRRECILEDSLVEKSLTAETKKKKRKDGGSQKGDDDESLMQYDFSEERISQRKYSDTESPLQVEESVKKKKKKRRKDELSQGADDLAEDDTSSTVHQNSENIKKSQKRLCRDDLPDKASCTEHPYLVDEPSATKKPKKHRRNCLLEDGLVEESLIPETQHATKKKKKCKDGGVLQEDGLVEESLIAEIQHATKKKKKWKDGRVLQEDGLLEESLIAEIQHATKKKKKWKDGGVLQEDGLVEESLIAEIQHATKKKKKWKDGGVLQEDGLVEESLVAEIQHASKKKKKWKDGGVLQEDGFRHQDDFEIPEQVEESVNQAERPVKKKKKKKREDEPPQEVEDMVENDASSSGGIHRDDLSYSEFAATEHGTIRRKKKKSKKDHAERPLEDSLAEESLNPDTQRVSEKKSKRKDSGDVDQAEVCVKKAKKKKHSDRREQTSDILTEETQLEDDVPADSAAMESDAEDDSEQASTCRLKTSPSTDADPNPATEEDGENRSATSDKNTRKAARKRERRGFSFLREQDQVLLNEYFPRIKSLSNSTVHNLVNQELERIRAAKQNGIMFHFGQFTIEEDEQIKQNVQKFTSQVGIDSAELLFHPNKAPDLKRTVVEIKRKFNFRQRIAEGLHRTSTEVYSRGEKLYDSASVKGRYTDEEVKQLKSYCELHGKDWKTIAASMNRTSSSSQLKASQLRREVNSGRWSMEETNCLITAVKEFVLDSLQKETGNKELVTIRKERLYKGISWVRIEEKVETRNWTHCKRKWFELILMRMNDHIHPFKSALGFLNSIKMIRWMHDSNIKDYCDVKWDKLSDFLGNVPPFCTQNKFVTLKKQVPDWKKLRLYEIVDWLYNDLVPKLEAQLASANESPIEPERKNKFLISEIFQECSELDGKWALPKYIAEVVCEGGGHLGALSA